MSIENIKEKIKKLLTLSESSQFDEESHTALKLAQELMVKYKLSQSDIKEEEVKAECIKKETILSYGTKSSDHYRSKLAKIIADNFCCINYITTPYRSRTHYVCFMGLTDDVDIACEAAYTADRAIVRGYNRVYKEVCKEYGLDYIPTKYFNPLKLGYIKGYLEGLKNALDKQREENQEWGLVLVVPQEAQEFKATLGGRSFSAPSGTDYSYYNEGYKDGSNFSLSKKLNESEIPVEIEGN